MNDMANKLTADGRNGVHRENVPKEVLKHGCKCYTWRPGTLWLCLKKNINFCFHANFFPYISTTHIFNLLWNKFCLVNKKTKHMMYKLVSFLSFLTGTQQGRAGSLLFAASPQQQMFTHFTKMEIRVNQYFQASLGKY